MTSTASKLPPLSEAPFSLVGPAVIRWWCGLARATPLGAFAELGVFRGGSAWHLAAVARDQARELFLYDTFTGIPMKSQWDAHNIGDFDETSEAEVRAVIPDAIFCVGTFPETFIEAAYAFVHVDADQHPSIVAACEPFGPCMVKGGVMVFDDYAALPGAARAVDECFAGRVLVGPEGKAYVRF